MPEWLIALEERGPAKPRGSSAVLEFEGGKHKDSVECVWQRGSEKWRAGRRRGARWVGYESRDCLGCQQHINTHLTAGGDICPSRCSVSPHFFSCPIMCCYLDLELLNSSEEKTRDCARRESCRMNAMQNWCRCLQTPQLYKFACTYESINASAALCLQLYVHVWMSHGSAQLVFWEMKRSLSLPFIWNRRWLEY